VHIHTYTAGAAADPTLPLPRPLLASPFTHSLTRSLLIYHRPASPPIASRRLPRPASHRVSQLRTYGASRPFAHGQAIASRRYYTARTPSESCALFATFRSLAYSLARCQQDRTGQDWIEPKRTNSASACPRLLATTVLDSLGLNWIRSNKNSLPGKKKNREKRGERKRATRQHNPIKLSIHLLSQSRPPQHIIHPAAQAQAQHARATAQSQRRRRRRRRRRQTANTHLHARAAAAATACGRDIGKSNTLYTYDGAMGSGIGRVPKVA
ncbi:hypothetical protein IWX90DRAFT_495597, partial [Phyllosticta citrichinensis]